MSLHCGAPRTLVVVALAFILGVPTLSLGAAAAAPPPSSGLGGIAAPAAGLAAPNHPVHTVNASSVCAGLGQTGTAAVAARSLESSGAVPAGDAFLPAPPRASDRASSALTSTYVAPPAPMGVADLGEGASGTYTYATNEFAGVASIQSLSSFSPGYSLWSSSPDWASLQLNAVVVNISRPAEPGGVYWAQDVARFNGSAIQFVDNIWNFSNSSGGGLRVGTFQSYSGTLVSCAFYYDAGPTLPLSAPFTLSLNESVFSSGGSPAVDFGYNLTDSSGNHRGIFDTVVFNSTDSPTAPATFEVNGSTPNPYGLRDDAEFVFGGDGGGSNADFEALNGSLTLDRWNAADGQLEAVPSAYDYGDDAAETSEGVASYYLGTTELVGAGPSFLYGLWNTTTEGGVGAASSGWVRLQLELQPSEGFLFATNGTSWSSAVASFVPTNGTGGATVVLPPPIGGQPYVFEGWANGFATNGTTSLTSNTSSPVLVDLTPSPGTLDAPVYVRSYSDLIALGGDGIAGVSFSAHDAALWVNGSVDALAPPFRQVNDYGGPIFTLFAVESLTNISVHLDNVSQSASTFTYSHGLASGISLPGWTEGFFLYGTASGSTVDQIRILGPPLGSAPFVDPLPAAVVLSGLRNASVRDLATNGTGTGLVLLEDQDVTVVNLTVGGNATGAFVENSTGVRITNLSVEGYTWSPPRISVPEGGPPNPGPLRLPARVSRTASPAGWWLTFSCASVSTNVLPTIDRIAAGPIGVCALNSSSIVADQFKVTGGGSWGFVGSGLTGVTASNWSVAGNGTVGQIVHSSAIQVSNLRVEFSRAPGWNFSYDRDVTGWNLSATGPSTDDVDGANDSANLRFWNITASDDGVGIAGIASSANVSVANVSATGGAFGALYFGFVRNLTFSNFRASGGSWGAAVFWTYGGTVRDFGATADSLGYLLEGGANVTVANVSATDTSVGVELLDLTDGAVTNVTASSDSIGVYVLQGSFLTLDSIRAGTESTGVYAEGLADSNLSDINASQASLGPSYYESPVFASAYAAAAVQLWLTSNLSIANVTALNYGFALWDLVSSNLTVQDVTSWNGGELLQSNYTSYSIFDRVFAYGERSGFDLFEPTQVTIEGSTVEACAGVAVGVFGGTNTTVFGNNFVGNDGASVNGSFNPGTVQATVAGGGTGNFSWDGIGNYWSDWSSSAPYGVGAGVVDRFPAPAFISDWLAFNETGLVPGLVWRFSLEGVTYATDQPRVDLPAWSVPVGVLPYAAVPPSGWSVTPAAGTVAFNGTNRTVTFRFSEPTYRVRFGASGLPNGTVWSVRLGNASESQTARNGTAQLSFTEPNGTYSYGLPTIAGYRETTIAANGTVPVNGANASLSAIYGRVVYTVAFGEVGLPPATVWSVTLNGTTDATSSGGLGFVEPNGSYPYRIATIAGWLETSRPYVGSVLVAGQNMTLTTSWRPVTYVVTFSETGLVAGGEWQVTFAGRTVPSTGTTVQIAVANGTYAFRIATPTSVGYSVAPFEGNVTVAGANTSVNCTFTATSSPASASLSPIWVVGSAVALVIAVVAVVVWWRRRPPPSSVPDEGRVYS